MIRVDESKFKWKISAVNCLWKYIETRIPQNIFDALFKRWSDNHKRICWVDSEMAKCISESLVLGSTFARYAREMSGFDFCSSHLKCENIDMHMKYDDVLRINFLSIVYVFVVEWRVSLWYFLVASGKYIKFSPTTNFHEFSYYKKYARFPIQYGYCIDICICIWIFNSNLCLLLNEWLVWNQYGFVRFFRVQIWRTCCCRVFFIVVQVNKEKQQENKVKIKHRTCISNHKYFVREYAWRS